MRVADVIDRDGQYFLRMRMKYQRLSPEQRAEIERGFKRHEAACKKIGIEPEAAWVCEVIADARIGGRAKLIVDN